ncbi:cation diffusion facilitator family transporter [Persephonella sp.]
MEKKKTVLFIVIILNLLIVISQIIFGIYAHSLALITDAVHNFQDVISLIIAFVAAIFMSKKPTERMTFGYLRSEAMAGFINSAFLIGAVVLIIISSIERLFYPQNVDSIYVIIVGFIAFVINALSAYFLGLHKHDKDDHEHEDLNIKAAYLHLLSDAGISLGVVAGGVLIYLFGIHWIDPFISILFSLYIFKETYPILKKTYLILMESVPPYIDPKELEGLIKKECKDIIEIHDLHVWALSSKDVYFTAHIVLSPSVTLEEFDEKITKISKILIEKGINHVTIQPETEKFKCSNIY